MYKVFPHKKAAQYYENLDDKTARRINKAIDAMCKNPMDGPHIKRLRGTHEGKYRYTVGDLRIVYRVNVEGKTILIEAIGQEGIFTSKFTFKIKKRQITSQCSEIEPAYTFLAFDGLRSANQFIAL